MSQIPVDINKASPKSLDEEILRVSVIAELDAINLYQQMAHLTKDSKIKAVLLEIAKEEKTHVGEFQTLLLKKDPEQVKEMAAGKKEVEDITG